MAKTQTDQERPTENPSPKGRHGVTPDRESGRELKSSRTRAGKLGEIAKEMKEVTVVADRIVALATKEESKSPTSHKSSTALPKARKLKSSSR
jgi:hypothetical protein